MLTKPLNRVSTKTRRNTIPTRSQTLRMWIQSNKGRKRLSHPHPHQNLSRLRRFRTPPTPTSFKFNGWGLHAEVGPIVDQNQEIRPLSWLPPGHENYGSRPSGSLEDDQMYSSRAMGILRYLDPTPMVTQRRSSDPEASKKTKLKHLKKQLSSVRRKLENLQISFEESQGYKPSQADKQGERNMRRLLLEQSQLQRQIRGYRDCDFLEDLDEGSNDSDKLVGLDLEVESPGDDTNSTDGSSGESVQNNNNDNNNSHKSKDLEAMRSTLDEIEECLNYQRTNKGRCVTLDEMTVEQLHDEKVDLHNAIRQFESAYGAPMDEDEKLVVKSLYDRYRTVKRLVRRSRASRAKDTTELETIPEGEALALTLASPPHRIHLEFNGSTSTTSPSGGLGKKRYVEDGLPVSKKNTPAEPEAKQPPTSESSGDDYSNDSEGPESKAEEENQRKRLDAEQYHSMSRFDLLQIFRKTREEKKQLRRLIKEKEEEFQKKTGRRLLREDRDKSETAYKQYKVTKAKVKLIEALLAKRAHEPMF
ncbi:protein FAM13A-like [Tigriopus californicus]|uniref:protein FAM13A-like n=1 Tax=Tigriopus californicus TaxID=6832 RepID=UPI0027D9F47B|nr:protein FAM13A-like [Tigriopus californicus]